MKIIIDTASFINAVNWVTKSFDNTDDKSISFSIIDGIGSLAYENKTGYRKAKFFVTSFDNDDSDEVKLSLAASYTKKLAAALHSTKSPSATITSKADSLIFTVQIGKFTVPTTRQRAPATPELSTIATVDGAEFFDYLTKLSKVSSPRDAETIPFLGSIAIRLKENTIQLFATDKYALVEVTLAADIKDDINEKVKTILEKGVLFPTHSANSISSSGVDLVDVVVEELDNDSTIRLGFIFDDGREAVFLLSEGETHPDNKVQQMKENALEATDYSATIVTSELKKSLKIISDMSWSQEDNAFIDFIFDNGEIVISDMAGSNKITLASENSVDNEEEIIFKFILETLNKALLPVSASKVQVKWGEDSRTIIFIPVIDDGTPVDNVFIMASRSS